MIDRRSLLITVSGDERLAEVEASLRAKELTLDLTELPDRTIDEWIGDGCPGARSPWLDPADHLVAGFEATFGKTRVRLVPAPRRAVGPDLFALLFGHRGRFGHIHRADLRIHEIGVVRPSFAFAAPEPEPNASEKALLDAIAKAIG